MKNFTLNNNNIHFILILVNQRLSNNGQPFENTETSISTSTVGESWKNGIYSTTEKIKSNQSTVQTIPGFGLTSNSHKNIGYNSQFLQDSKSQDASFFSNNVQPNISANLKHHDGIVNIAATSTSNIVHEVNGYSATMTQPHSYQQHFVSYNM